MRRSTRFSFAFSFVVLCCSAQFVRADESASDRFRTHVLPVLSDSCFDCHGGGAEEGGLVLDGDPDSAEFLADKSTWAKVLKNVRAGVMPPEGSTPPSPEALAALETWVKTDVFQIDPDNIDPGPAAVRRLNRFEYGNTIRDLMGIDYNVEIEFPPDDSGFGFDNVGEAQSLSPMLVEKYLHAAQSIVDAAVPRVSRVLQYQDFRGDDFRNDDNSRRGNRMSVDDQVTVTRTFTIDEPGQYRLTLNALVDGSFEFHPGRCTVTFSLNGQQRSQDEYGWAEKMKVEKVFDEHLDAGEHTLTFQVEPLPQPEQEGEDVDDFSDENHDAHYFIRSVKLEGPLDPPKWQHPANYTLFFHRDQPPTDDREQREYAREVLQRFASRAFRRPVDEPTLERLTSLAESIYTQPDHTFEAGVAHAMVAVLASPRFLLRTDFAAEPATEGGFPLVDQYSLASRLSYYLWSTMPDQTLLDLAERGELLDQFDQQVDRLLKDDRSRSMMREFVGQWLRSRDVENVSIDPLAAMGLREEYDTILDEFRARFRRRRPSQDQEEQTPEQKARAEEIRNRFRELRELRDQFNAGIRRAMRDETELTFEHIVREDRSTLELLDSNYTFLNEDLANYYGIEGVQGRRMRKVELPADSPRGGVLTQGTMLTVTSNPTRTSPVKRGLFILENLLGTPPPPAPPGIPGLEESAKVFGDREPTLRETLELHRDSPLCSSCHSRMDPLGLALENFDALGNWREMDKGQPVDASGELVSGDTFTNIRELKHILTTTQRRNFYRCMTEKMLTYALGRGLDYYDVHTVDAIVDELDRNDGRIGVLLQGVVRSAPFLRHRGAAGKQLTDVEPPQSNTQARLTSKTESPGTVQ